MSASLSDGGAPKKGQGLSRSPEDGVGAPPPSESACASCTEERRIANSAFKEAERYRQLALVEQRENTRLQSKLDEVNRWGSWPNKKDLDAALDLIAFGAMESGLEIGEIIEERRAQEKENI